MKRPWQIWFLYVLSLALVLPALGWLSVKAIELDRREAAARRQTEEARRREAEARAQAELARGQADLARQQAELQELASSALWRMDWTLTPIIAQEAARPYYVYLPFYPSPAGKSAPDGKEGLKLAPSPLLLQPSEFVLLNFQVSADNLLTSPQCPVGSQFEAALEAGATRERILENRDRLLSLNEKVQHERLLALLPQQMLPPVELNPETWMANTFNFFGGRTGVENTTVTYDLGLQQLAKQIEDQKVELGDRRPGGGPQTPNSNETNLDTSNVTRSGGRDATGGRVPAAQASSSGGGEASELPPNSIGPPASNSQLSRANDNFNFDPEANRRGQMLRGGNEWQRRNRAFESYAQSQLVQQRQALNPAQSAQVVSEGVSRPIWVGGQLLLARRVHFGERVLVQGCWLDWPKLKAMLQEEVADLLPEVELEPVLPHGTVAPGRALATLPVQLVLPEPWAAPASQATASLELAYQEEPWLSPIRLSLLAAWVCLFLATFAVGILLQGVVTLSERRGAFVSAVTHELRTPLTTFRMYAEMLASGMVPKAEQRQKYLDTLRVEADRLAHLVENVLAYARLERGNAKGRLERISLGSLLERSTLRLAERANQAEMTLAVEGDEMTRESVMLTDPTAVEQILFNLVDNACKYASGASDKRIHLCCSVTGKRARIEVFDHGPGISAAASKRLFRPFSKSVHEAASTAPGVGLGLALSRRLAHALGGSLDIVQGESGARFVLLLPLA